MVGFHSYSFVGAVHGCCRHFGGGPDVRGGDGPNSRPPGLAGDLIEAHSASTCSAYYFDIF